MDKYTLGENIFEALKLMVETKNIDTAFNTYNKMELWLKELYNIKEIECE